MKTTRRLTMQEVLDYMYLKGDEGYSLTELVAGFCLAGNNALPIRFTDEFIGYSNREELSKVLKQELGEELYERRWEDFLTEATKMYVKVIEERIERGDKRTMLGIYAREKMYNLQIATMMSFPTKEYRVKQRRNMELFKEHLNKSVEGRDIYSYILTSVENDWWVTGEQ